MKVVINVEKSQLREVLQELGGSFSDMDIVINIQEGEPKEKLDHQYVTTENLEQFQKEMEKKEEEKYPT